MKEYNLLINIYMSKFIVICGAPAKAFVKNVKQYSGYHSCDKCTQGEWKGKKTFPESHASMRTANSFIMMTNEDHHKGP